ncbi:hypothetical protein V8C86DRAFT_115234 [Haematococcus lacustris]
MLMVHTPVCIYLNVCTTYLLVLALSWLCGNWEVVVRPVAKVCGGYGAARGVSGLATCVWSTCACRPARGCGVCCANDGVLTAASAASTALASAVSASPRLAGTAAGEGASAPTSVSWAESLLIGTPLPGHSPPPAIPPCWAV